MIYTITLNPSIDHYIFMQKDTVPESTNRAERSVNLCGGKGINVSIVCKSLGVRTVCTGFYGGFTGEELIRQINRLGINSKFVKVDAETRINTKIVCRGKVTEINAKGQKIKEAEAKKLLDVLSTMSDSDTAVLSGSVPDAPGLLTSVLEHIKKTGARLIADTSGKTLAECIKYRPYLIKPNREELAGYFGVDPIGVDVPVYANKLAGLGAENVIVSDGERGAYFADKSGCRYLPVVFAGFKARNTTGAGDSMIAGYLYGEKNRLDPFICAVGAGSASAYSDGLFDKNIFDDVIKSYKQV